MTQHRVQRRLPYPQPHRYFLEWARRVDQHQTQPHQCGGTDAGDQRNACQCRARVALRHPHPQTQRQRDAPQPRRDRRKCGDQHHHDQHQRRNPFDPSQAHPRQGKDQRHVQVVAQHVRVCERGNDPRVIAGRQAAVVRQQRRDQLAGGCRQIEAHHRNATKDGHDPARSQPAQHQPARKRHVGERMHQHGQRSQIDHAHPLAGARPRLGRNKTSQGHCHHVQRQPPMKARQPNPDAASQTQGKSKHGASEKDIRDLHRVAEKAGRLPAHERQCQHSRQGQPSSRLHAGAPSRFARCGSQRAKRRRQRQAKGHAEQVVVQVADKRRAAGHRELQRLRAHRQRQYGQADAPQWRARP